jgi:hypothetical protein
LQFSKWLPPQEEPSSPHPQVMSRSEHRPQGLVTLSSPLEMLARTASLSDVVDQPQLMVERVPSTFSLPQAVSVA